MSIANNTEVQGRLHNGNFFEQAARIQASAKSGLYTAKTLTVATATTDASLNSTLDSTFFSPLSGNIANFFEIITDYAISFKVRTKANSLTSTANLKSITMLENSSMTVDFIADITDILISNASGSTATITIIAI